MSLICRNCGYVAAKKDYECPTCKKKFRPLSITIIFIITLIYSIFLISPVMILFSIGIFLMKQWARRLLFVAINIQILWYLVFAGFDISQIIRSGLIYEIIIFLIIFIPIGVYLMNNDQLIEAFDFYGGRIWIITLLFWWRLLLNIFLSAIFLFFSDWYGSRSYNPDRPKCIWMMWFYLLLSW